jgi:hypothetical protein
LYGSNNCILLFQAQKLTFVPLDEALLQGMFRKEVTMNIKEILSDIIPKAEISEENRKTLSDWLGQFEKVPENKELLETIDQLKAERDSAKKSLDDMIFKNHVAELADNYSFSDKDYLEYLCKTNNVDFADAASSKNFMNKLQLDSPKFFKINLQSGTGTASAVPEYAPVKKNHQIDDILSLLNNAPEIRG